MRPYMRPYSRLLRNPGPRQAPQPAPALPPAKFFFLATRPPWSLCFYTVCRGVRGYVRPCMRPYSRLLRNPWPRQAPQPPPALPPAKFFFSCDQTPMEPLFSQRFQGDTGLHEAIHEAILPLAAKLRAPPSITTAPGPPPAKFFFSCDQTPMEQIRGKIFPANLCTGRRAFQPRPQITDYSHLLRNPGPRQAFGR